MRTQDKIHLNYCNEPGYPLSATIQIFVNSNKFYFPSHRSAAELVPEDRNEQRWLYGFPERGPHRELAAGESCRLFAFPGAPWRESAAAGKTWQDAGLCEEKGAYWGGSGRQVRLPAPGRGLPWSLGIRICILFERQSFEFWMI